MYFTRALEHNGGDRIDSDSLEVIVSNVDDSSQSVNGTVSGSLSVGDVVSAEIGADGGSPTVQEVRIRIIHGPSDSIILDTTQELNDPVVLDQDNFSMS